MKYLTNEDFLRLIEELSDDVDESDFSYENSWMPADPPAKDKIKPPGNGMVDLTNVKKGNVKDILYKSTIFKIGLFTIRITKYHSYPTKNNKEQDLKIDLTFLREVDRTPSGAPCKMQYKFDIGKDSRFANRPWLSYLSDSSNMKNVPIEDAVEIIRWFQGLHRMTAFL